MVHTPKIDVHYHPGEWPFLIAGVSAADISLNLDHFNIACAICSHSKAIVSDSREGNREVVQLCAKDPRLRAYLYINPHDIPGTIEDLRSYGTNPSVVGVKTGWPYNGGLFLIDADEYKPLLEEAAHRQLSLLYHGVDGPSRSADHSAVLKVVDRFPGWKLIWTHASLRDMRALQSNRRIFFDIASSGASRFGGHLEAMVEVVGHERIVFGSDAPLSSPALAMGKFDSADLTWQQRQAIYYDNALKAFPRLKL